MERNTRKKTDYERILRDLLKRNKGTREATRTYRS